MSLQGIYICSMILDDALITKLADLSKLEFNDEERVRIKKNLSRILQMVEKINEVNLDHIQPLIYMNDAVNVLRKDEIEVTLTHEEAMMNAPAADAFYFKVPKVLS